MKRLAICLPQTETVRMEYARSLATMMLHLGNVEIPDLRNVDIFGGTSSIVPMVRQTIADRAIARHATHLLWIDADHSFPGDTAHRLLAHERPYVGINATTRQYPVQATAMKRRDERLRTTQHSKGLERVYRVGLGIALIEARVFLAVPRPWFMVEYIDDEDGTRFRGEDIYFCEKAKAAGFQPMVDHDLTKETAHIGSVGWNTSALEELTGITLEAQQANA